MRKNTRRTVSPWSKSCGRRSREETNRNLYTLTMFSVRFLPATLIASIWGMNVGGIPFSGSSNGFWVVAEVIAAVFTLFAIVLYLLRFRFF